MRTGPDFSFMKALDLKEAQNRALAFYQAFRNSNDYMFYTDQHAVILDVNDSFIRRFGYSRQEAIGQTPRLVR